MAELKFIPTQVPSDSCAPWPKCLDLSEPQFPHLYSEAVPGTALWGSFEKITFIYFWLLRVLVTMQGLLFPCGSWVYLPSLGLLYILYVCPEAFMPRATF